MSFPSSYVGPVGYDLHPRHGPSGGFGNEGSHAGRADALQRSESPENPDEDRPLSPMDEQQQQMFFRLAVSDAIAFTDLELSPARATMTRFYNGEPFGDEEEGRSSVILTVVRDEIQAAIRQVMPVFFGSEQTVELTARPRSIDPQMIQMAVQGARQASDYINFVWNERLDGFGQSLAVLNDGMLKRIGVFKWGWDESETKRAYCDYELSEEAMHALAADDDVMLTKVQPEREEDVAGAIGPMGAALAPPMTYTVEYTKKENDGKPWVQAVPPEEFVFSREARNKRQALLLAHRMQKTRGELVALGIDGSAIDMANEVATLTLAMQPEVIARREQITNAFMQDPKTGEANDKITYVEGYMHMDVDGDGIAELRKIIGLGQNYVIYSNEPWDEPPFAIYTYDPAPHTLQGGSLADRVADLQHIKSLAARAMFDSLSISVFPTRFVQQGGVVNVADLYNNAVGQNILTSRPPAEVVQIVQQPFAGEKIMPVMQWLDSVQDERSGYSKGANNLDPDALQSMDSQAAAAVVNASQAQIEHTCRIFAQTMKEVMRGLYRLYITHKPKKEVVQLRGHWVEVNPAAWESDMDVTINVGLGTSFIERKRATLRQIIMQQEKYLQLLGPTNPLVSLPQLSNAIAQTVELDGFKDTTSYFSKLPPNWTPPPPQGPPPPSPEQMLAQTQLQVEQMKNQTDMQMKQAELELKQADLEFRIAKDQADREMTKAVEAAKLDLEREQINAQFGAQVTQAQMDHDQKQEQAMLNAQIAKQQQMHDQAIAEIKTAHDIAMQHASAHHDKQMSEIKLHMEQMKHEAAMTKATSEKAAPTAKAQPASNIHVHIPGQKARKTKIVRDEQGNLSGLEDVPSDE